MKYVYCFLFIKIHYYLKCRFRFYDIEKSVFLSIQIFCWTEKS